MSNQVSLNIDVQLSEDELIQAIFDSFSNDDDIVNFVVKLDAAVMDVDFSAKLANGLLKSFTQSSKEWAVIYDNLKNESPKVFVDAKYDTKTGFLTLYHQTTNPWTISGLALEEAKNIVETYAPDVILRILE